MSRRRSVGRAGGVRCWQTGIIEKVRLRLLSRVIDRSGGGVVRSLGRRRLFCIAKKMLHADQRFKRAHMLQNINFIICGARLEKP